VQPWPYHVAVVSGCDVDRRALGQERDGGVTGASSPWLGSAPQLHETGAGDREWPSAGRGASHSDHPASIRQRDVGRVLRGAWIPSADTSGRRIRLARNPDRCCTCNGLSPSSRGCGRTRGVYGEVNSTSRLLGRCQAWAAGRPRRGRVRAGDWTMQEEINRVLTDRARRDAVSRRVTRRQYGGERASRSDSGTCRQRHDDSLCWAARRAARKVPARHGLAKGVTSW